MISPLACSLVGQSQAISLLPGTQVRQAYGAESAVEQFRCNYGLNPAYRPRFAGGELVVAGVDAEGEVRIVELNGHPFFVATLFLPQMSSSYEKPHPLIVAYLQAARNQLQA